MKVTQKLYTYVFSVLAAITLIVSFLGSWHQFAISFICAVLALAAWPKKQQVE